MTHEIIKSILLIMGGFVMRDIYNLIKKIICPIEKQRYGNFLWNIKKGYCFCEICEKEIPPDAGSFNWDITSIYRYVKCPHCGHCAQVPIHIHTFWELRDEALKNIKS